MPNFRSEAESIENKLIDIRRTIHQNPELGFLEKETSEFICKKLDELGIEYKKGIARTGIIAKLKGGKGDGKRLLIRADMDALPLIEETNLPFQSKNHEVFHACGHDSHISCLLGAAEILKKHQNEFKGTILFTFQPAEEGSLEYDPTGKIAGGSLPMILEGALGDPKNPEIDGALALHIDVGGVRFLKVGSIGIKDAEFSGSADEYYIVVKGKGGHASSPHAAIDPVYIASQINVAIQGYISRINNPVEPVVFTIGKIGGGFRHNIISETCSMEGTLRTLNEEVRNKLNDKLPNFIKNIAKAYDGDADVKLVLSYPVGFNDKKMNDHIKKVTKEMYGEDAIAELEKAQLGGEDFYEFGFKNTIPIAMFYLGGSNLEKGMVHSNHSNKFDFDEKALPMGAAILSATAISFLNEN